MNPRLLSFIQQANHLLLFVGGIILIGSFTASQLRDWFQVGYYSEPQVKVVSKEDAVTAKQPTYSKNYLGKINDVYVFEQTVDLMIQDDQPYMHKEEIVIKMGLSPSSNAVNLLFSKSTGEKRQLFEKPTLIAKMATPESRPERTTLTKNVYAVVHSDTNGDGVLNGKDQLEILLSEYDGAQLRSIIKDASNFGVIGADLLMIETGTGAKTQWYTYDIQRAQLTPLDSSFQ